MDTWCLVDAGVFFTFFYSFLFGLFFGGGALQIFFSELPHCVSHSVRTNFFWTLWVFF